MRRRGWLGLLLRVVAVLAVLGSLVWWAVDERNERAENMKRLAVMQAEIRVEGSEDDPLFGRQYAVFYAGTMGRPPLDCRQIAELYEAIGSKPRLWESVNGGCKLTFAEKPNRIIQSIRINGLNAKVVVSGPVQPADTARMTENLLNIAWDHGVKARAVGEIKQTTSPDLWEGEFVFQFGDN